MKVKVRAMVACFNRNALVTKIQEDLIPFSGCTGIQVECSKNNLITVKASCSKAEAPMFLRMIRSISRKPLLSGRKRRR